MVLSNNFSVLLGEVIKSSTECTHLIVKRWLFKGCRECVVKCIITVQNSYRELAAGDKDSQSGAVGIEAVDTIHPGCYISFSL